MERRVSPAIYSASEGCGASDVSRLHWGGEAAPQQLTGSTTGGLPSVPGRVPAEKCAFPARLGGFEENLYVLSIGLCPLDENSRIPYPDFHDLDVSLSTPDLNSCQFHVNFCQLDLDLRAPHFGLCPLGANSTHSRSIYTGFILIVAGPNQICGAPASIRMTSDEIQGHLNTILRAAEPR